MSKKLLYFVTFCLVVNFESFAVTLVPWKWKVTNHTGLNINVALVMDKCPKQVMEELKSGQDWETSTPCCIEQVSAIITSDKYAGIQEVVTVPGNQCNHRDVEVKFDNVTRKLHIKFAQKS